MNAYERTVQAIKDLDKIPSKQEWNMIANNYECLLYSYMRYNILINLASSAIADKIIL